MSKNKTGANPLDEAADKNQGGGVDLSDVVELANATDQVEESAPEEEQSSADVQSAEDLAPAVEPDKAPEAEDEVVSDKEIIRRAREGLELTPDQHERLRFIPAADGTPGGYKDLWTKHEFRYGEKESVFIPLASGEKLAHLDKNGKASYPMEFTSISEVRCYVPKGRSVTVPKLVADVLRPYIESLHPDQYQFQNLSAPEFHYE